MTIVRGGSDNFRSFCYLLQTRTRNNLEAAVNKGPGALPALLFLRASKPYFPLSHFIMGLMLKRLAAVLR